MTLIDAIGLVTYIWHIYVSQILSMTLEPNVTSVDHESQHRRRSNEIHWKNSMQMYDVTNENIGKKL